MQTWKTVYRLFLWLALGYTLLETLRRSRAVLAAAILWRILRWRPWASSRRVAAFRLVDDREPAIYRRRGLRKMIP
ncbi:hypothetical protein [Alicyclobacillus shizuokensis]|uniref:hypothetical protein n=1 Tax=Alicyclobacillus shizuokensis TaxID=392014 RepID=UPI00082B813F|nr:hypothetical protein [Alicyclobacillus shizuokensis]MCL6627348.1 hypothetical protein [Alicyclobacillus shizuokensis]